MKINVEVREIARLRGGPAGEVQRVTLDPVPDPGDESVDGYLARQLQLVVTKLDDFLPDSVRPGEVIGLSIRVYERD